MSKILSVFCLIAIVIVSIISIIDNECKHKKESRKIVPGYGILIDTTKDFDPKYDETMRKLRILDSLLYLQTKYIEEIKKATCE